MSNGKSLVVRTITSYYKYPLNKTPLNLILDKEHLSWMESRWKNRGLVMPENNIKQAEVPEGAKKLNNTNGTSPGIHIEVEDKHIFILPGPPREFNPLVSDEIIPP